MTEEPVESTYTTTTEYTYPKTTEAIKTTEVPEPIQAPVQETEQESIQEPATEPADEPVYYNDNNLNGMPGVKITDTTIIETNGFKLYNFKKSGSTGATLDPEHYKNMPFELYYGLTVNTEGTVVTYRAYNHLNQELSIEWTSVESGY